MRPPRRRSLLMGTSAAGFAVVGSADEATEDSIDIKLRATLPKFTIASRCLA